MQDQRFFFSQYLPFNGWKLTLSYHPLPSLVVYLPSSFGHGQFINPQTLLLEPVSFSALASWKIPCPVVAAA